MFVYEVIGIEKVYISNKKEYKPDPFAFEWTASEENRVINPRRIIMRWWYLSMQRRGSSNFLHSERASDLKIKGRSEKRRRVTVTRIVDGQQRKETGPF